MITLRPASERGRTNLDWLDSRHTFSFGDYYDGRHEGFRTLRVINDDRVRPGKGFGTHSHRDMEIVSVVLEGALEHRDSLGTGSVIRPGDVQKMTAGTGVSHSEFNPSPGAPVRFLQIWIIPERRGLAPEYQQKAFPEAERRDRLRPIVTGDGRDGSIVLYQDADIFAGHLEPGREVTHRLVRGRAAWVHVHGGRIDLAGQTLGDGDGAQVSDEERLVLRALDGAAPARFLLFDLA
jgi:redox-sensitive bicupin YhaK (pirin superfamily)